MATTHPQAFHVMAKPTGAKCNLKCDYCFFLTKEQLYPDSRFRMTDEVMQSYIRQTIEAHRTPQVTIAWQGGEPTLMGLDFFKRAVDFELEVMRPGMTVENTLQTNGVLLDDAWCEFLSEKRFLVGLSLDGPRDLHDTYRRDKGGNSVFDKVIGAARLMQKHNVEFNILCTVNAANSMRPLDVYKFFRDELNTPYLQFIPIVERDHSTGDLDCMRITDRSVQSGQYGKFLIEIFDEWVRRDVGKMFVQFFDGVLASYLRGRSSLCILQPTCGEGVALEHNGDVYSCDHFVEPRYLLGNIVET
ncbi:MAG: anaerobic sulfatase maturase, partial [Armatimonadota bacterium]